MPGAYTWGMRVLPAFLLAAAILSWAIPARADIQLHIENGQVSLKATNATVRDILAEWARVGQTKIVNGEKLTTMVTLNLVEVPEKKALEVLLRSASGFLVAERKDPIAGASRFDRVLILPFSQAPAYTPTASAPTVPQPFVNRPPMPMPPELDDLQQLPTQQQQPANMPQTLPTPGMMPQPIGPGGQQQPLTSPRPGFLPPPAPTPVKPPGGGDQ